MVCPIILGPELQCAQKAFFDILDWTIFFIVGTIYLWRVYSAGLSFFSINTPLHMLINAALTLQYDNWRHELHPVELLAFFINFLYFPM